ncbi:MAG: secretin and TonB N-terminal domain-containing protein [Deltaproteobacteria bacterium]|nr:secretin and TonB N-terminal domain-containing protein [Deltaproteobacteria bacterium]
MKKFGQWTWIAFLIGFVVFSGDAQNARSAPYDPGAPDNEKIGQSAMVDVGYLEDVTFERIRGRERVYLVLSRQSGVNVENAAGQGVLVTMENMFVPEDLRRPLGEGVLDNVVRVLPAQRVAGGKQWALVTIDMKKRVPFSVRQEGMNVLIDFNTGTLAGGDLREVSAAAAAASKPSAEGGPTTAAVAEPRTTEGAAYPPARKMSLDFQDANIKTVLRLLAEENKINIVSGEDVKGNVTVSMRNVTWEQALDTLLDINGLTMKQEGNVITIMTLEKHKRDEAARKAAEDERRKAEEERKAREQKLLVEKGKLKQISIEAKIVEVNTTFARQLGLIWGYGYQDTWRSRNYGVMAGNSGPITGTVATALPTGIGLTSSNLAVNFPSAAAAAAPAIGVVIGSAKFALDAKIEALETTGDGKVISAPKVMTMDNETATIGQGEEIPYVQRDSEGNATVTMKDAKLQLVVTPKITPDGKISMKIQTENKYADWGKTNTNNENPPLVASNLDSRVVINNGDTIVVGGIYKTTESSSESGVPWLSKIPVLGWLFKYETKTKETREILIFVTPTIAKTG